ncbi:MAG: phage holin, LLH family [Desulfitobacteriaceae bacterium]
MDAQITSLLTDVITLAGTILIGFLTAFVKQHYSAKQVETAKTVAKTAVGFAEEIGTTMGLNGKDKFSAALGKARDLAGKYGIKLTDTQWEGLINASVNESRAVWDSLQGSSPTTVVNTSQAVTIPPETVQPTTTSETISTPPADAPTSSTLTIQQAVAQGIKDILTPVAVQAGDQTIQEIIDTTVSNATSKVNPQAPAQTPTV